jgi:hypothetical protein
VGFLVQSYDASNSLVGTPIYQQNILFDEGSPGTIGYYTDEQSQSLNETVITPGFFVFPDRWYAIWFWCGGNLHAVASETPESTSWAFERMDASVPYFLLYSP